jgi:Transposase IS4
LKPVATGPLSKTVEFDADHLPELPTYKQPLDLEFKASESLATGLIELQTYRKLLTPAIIDTIVNATNSYAKNARANASTLRQPRSWKSVNSVDIWRYLGCLVYMGIHMNRKYEEHWLKNGYLRQFMNLKRFQQIHRYCTLQDKSVHPRKEGETFAWPVEPIATTVKQKQKVKLPNKPIKE